MDPHSYYVGIMYMYMYQFRTIVVVSMARQSHLKRSILASWGPDALAVVRLTGVYQLDFFCSGFQFYVLLSPYLCFTSFLYLDLYVLGDDAWIS